MFCKPSDTKSTLKLVAIVAAAMAIVAGVAVLVTKLVNKKKTKKYYIECDCGENEPVIEPECDTDGQTVTE